MVSTHNFTVEPVGDPGDHVPTFIHVEAMSPVHAAEVALGESLQHFGSQDVLRAKVWTMGDNFTPTCCKLYRRPEEP
ncbi:MAG TPA: hypothetical protein VFE52_03315 [Devosia sp.]|nr:hypothetical protein [Devosia sp.]